MNKVNSLNQLGSLLFYFILQVFFIDFLPPSHRVSCFVYTAFLLLYPHQEARLSFTLTIAFIVGITVDVWQNAIGVHAFACVLMMYVRAFLLRALLPKNAYNVAFRPTLSNLGWGLFPFFAFVLIALHHTAVFALDVAHPRLLLMALPKIALSTLLTYASILVVQTTTRLLSRR